MGGSLSRLRAFAVSFVLLTLTSALPGAAFAAPSEVASPPEIAPSAFPALPLLEGVNDPASIQQDLLAQLNATRAREQSKPPHASRAPSIPAPEGPPLVTRPFEKPAPNSPQEAPKAPRVRDAPPQQAAALAPLASETTRLIVGFHEMPKDGVALGDAWDGGVVVGVNAALRVIVVDHEAPGQVSAAQERAQARADVAFAEPDEESVWVADAPAAFFPGDSLYLSQYAPEQVNAPLAWALALGDSASAAVCIVDTGVRYTHEDLAGRYLGGFDFVADDAEPLDENGHGTHVAGIAAASIDNAVGIAGAANVGFYAVRVLDRNGQGSFFDIAQGIQWCAENGMERTIISLSLGGSFSSVAMRNAVDYAAARGMVLVAAAGNSGPCVNCVGYPAAYDKVIAVACTTSEGDVCGFSSNGPEVDLAAPGFDIKSLDFTSDSSYRSESGTSMSAPLVSGLLALAWGENPTLTAVQLRSRLEATTRDVAPEGRDAATGAGEIDAYCLLVAMSPCAPADVIPPRLRFAEALMSPPGRLVVRFSEVLDASSVPSASDFAGTLDGSPLSLVSVAVSGNELRVDAAESFGPAHAILVSFTQGSSPLRDTAGNLASSFEDVDVDTSALPDSDVEQGADAFYSFASSFMPSGPSYHWIDVSRSGRSLHLDDDTHADVIRMPFAVPFYEAYLSDVIVSSNGYVTFANDSDDRYRGEALPSSRLPDRTFAALYGDLDPGEGGEMRYDTVGEPGSRTFVVSWLAVPYFNSGIPVTFQIQIHEADGSLEGHYLDVPEDNDEGDYNEFAIGLQRNAENGLTYIHGILALRERAIRFANLREFACVPSIPMAFVQLLTTDALDLHALADGESANAAWSLDGTGLEGAPTTLTRGRHQLAADVECGGEAAAADVGVERVELSVLALDPDELPRGVTDAAVAIVDGLVYVMGGFGEQDYYDIVDDTVYVYDPATHRVALAPWVLPEPRAGADALVHDGRIFLVGGYGNSGYDESHEEEFSNVVRIDPATGESQSWPIPTAWFTYGARSVLDPRATPGCPEGCIYVFGVVVTHLSVGRFNIATGDFTFLSDRPWTSQLSAVSYVDGLIVAMGGYVDDEGYDSDAVTVYDPLADRFYLSRDSLPSPTIGALGFADGEFAYSLGGWDDEEDEGGLFRYDLSRDVVDRLDYQVEFDSEGARLAVDGENAYVVGSDDDRDMILVVPYHASVLPPRVALLDYDARDPACDGTPPPPAEATRFCDATGNGNNGTLQGFDSPAWAGDGSAASPYRLAFDGVDDLVVAQERSFWGGDLDVVSVEATFRTTTPGGKLVGFESSTAGPGSRYDRHLFLDEEGVAHFGVFPGFFHQIKGGAGLADGEWHTVTGVLHNYGSISGMQLFVDGVLVARGEAQGAEHFSGYWRVGSGNLGGWTTGANAFTGDIARVRVFDRALSWSEIAPAIRAATIPLGMPSSVAVHLSKPVDVATLPAASDFSLLVDAVPVPVTGVRAQGDTLLLDVGTLFAFTSQGSVSYQSTAPMLDSFGMAFDSFDGDLTNLLDGPLVEVGGPDAFGYTFVSSHAPGAPESAFIDLAGRGEPRLLLTDDGMSSAVEIGFDFEYYGTTHHTLHISPDGFVVFDRPFARLPCAGAPLPVDGVPFPMIAGLWSDYSPATGSGLIRTATLGTAPQRVFVAEWHEVSQFDFDNGVTFQIQLHENGEIVIAYPQTTLLGSETESDCAATIGIQSAGGLDGLTYRYGADRLPATAITFRPPAAADVIGFEFEPAHPVVNEVISFQGAGALGALPLAWQSFDAPIPEAEAAFEGALPSVTHAFNAPGVHFVSLTVGEGESARVVTRMVRVVEANLLPTTSFLGGAAPVEGKIVVVPSIYGLSLMAEAAQELGDLAGMLIVYDPSNGASWLAGPEFEFINYLPAVVGMPNAALIVDYDLLRVAHADAPVSVWKYDPVTDELVRESHINVLPAYLAQGAFDPRATARCPEGCAYFAMGLDFEFGFVQQILEYNVATGQVRQTGARDPEGILYQAAGFARNGVQFFGGIDVDGGTTNATIRYDPATNRARILEHGLDASPHQGIALASGFSAGRSLGIAGGFGNIATNSLSTGVHIVNTITGESTRLGDMATPAWAPFASDDENLYRLGGFLIGSGIFARDVERFALPPFLSGIHVSGVEIELTFSKGIDPDSIPGPGDFSIRVDGLEADVMSVAMGVPAAGASIQAAGDSPSQQLNLVLGEPVTPGQSVEIDYTPGDAPIQDASGLATPDFQDQAYSSPPPPTISATPASPNGLAGWYTSAPQISLAGMGSIEYCVTAEETCTPLTPYAAPFALPEGVSTIRARAVLEGEPSNVAESIVRVDLTPPTATMTGSTGTLAGSAASMAIDFSEPMDRASTEAALAGGAEWALAWNAESLRLDASSSSLSEGAHTLALSTAARDAHGVALLGSASRSVTVPATAPPPSAPPPSVSVPSAPGDLAAIVHDGQVLLSWTPPGRDGGSPVQGYRVSRTSPGNGYMLIGTVATPGFTDTTPVPGVAYTYAVSAYTAAGTGAAAITTAMLPAAVPTSAIHIAPATPDGADGWYKSVPVIVLDSPTPGATIRFAWDGATFNDYAAPLAPPSGASTLTWFARAEGAADEAPHSQAFKVDADSPTLSASLSANTLVLPGSFGISASASDVTSGIASVIARVSGPASAEIPIVGTATFAPTLLGSYSVIVTATDRAGRSTSSAPMTISVAAPTIPLEPSSTSTPTTATPTSGAGAGSAGAPGPGSAGGAPSPTTTSGGGGGASPPTPRVFVVGATFDNAADGVVTVRVENAPPASEIILVVVSPDGSEHVLGTSANEASWNTTGFDDGYYTIESREKKSDGRTVVIASTVILVRHPKVTMGQAIAGAVAGVGTVAVGTAIASAVMSGGGSAASSVATSSVSAGASRGFDLFGYLRELMTDAGSDALKDKTRNFGDLERRRKIRSIVSILVTVVVLSVFFTYAAIATWNWADFWKALPIFGGAAVLIALQKFGTEAFMSRATGLKPHFKMWVAGIVSLAGSAMFFNSPFGYPGYVDREGPAKPTAAQRRIVGIQGLGIVLATAAWALPFVFIARFVHFDLGDIGIAMVFTAVATSAMPLGPLPGKEVWQWNKPLALTLALGGFLLYVSYALAFLPTVAITALGIAGLAAYVAIFAYLRTQPIDVTMAIPVRVNVPVQAGPEDAPSKKEKKAKKQ